MIVVGLMAAAHTVAAASAAGNPQAAAPPRASASQTTALHALGVLLSGQLDSFQLSESEFKAVLSGFADGYHHPAAMKDARVYVPQLKALEQTRAEAAAQREERAGQRYLNRVASLPGARKTPSGLVYQSIAGGSGPSPKLGDQVRVQYTGKLTDGTVFDASAQHGDGGPATLTLGRVIPCWDEGLQLMKVGGKARLVCPASLAYGSRGAGGVIKPGAVLDFDVQLLGIEHAPAQPGAPLAPSTPAAPR